VSPVKYELGSYIPEDAILHSHRGEHHKSYRTVPAWAQARTRTEGRDGDNKPNVLPSLRKYTCTCNFLSEVYLYAYLL
jgi:hypothetical protein